MARNPGLIERTSVLVAGGGGSGPTASMLYALQDTERPLIGERPETPDLRRAHVLEGRAMEILEGAGAVEQIRRRGTPPENMRATTFYTGFAGPNEEYGRRLARPQRCHAVRNVEQEAEVGSHKQELSGNELSGNRRSAGTSQ